MNEMNETGDFITIFAGSEPEPQTTSQTTRGFIDDSARKVAAKVSKVAVNTLQENFRRFFESMNTIISASPPDVGGLALDEVEIQAQIDSKGNIGISGIAGAELAVHGGIKFVLRKKL